MWVSIGDISLHAQQRSRVCCMSVLRILHERQDGAMDH